MVRKLRKMLLEDRVFELSGTLSERSGSSSERSLKEGGVGHGEGSVEGVKTLGGVGSQSERSETFAFAPDWLFGAWSDRGASGFWDPGLTGTPALQVRFVPFPYF